MNQEVKQKGRIKELDFIVDDNNCHICISHKPNGDGYPYMYREKKFWRISRYIYYIHNGPIPDGLVIRHKCDNRLCINIEHLEIGTTADNNRDRKVRGRNRNQRGERNNMSKLNVKQVNEIRRLYFTDKMFQKDIAKLFKVSQTLISKIVLHKYWTHA